MSMPTLLRPAVPSDCQHIYNAHKHAVQYTCRNSYDENVLNAWSQLLLPSDYLDTIKDPNCELWVIEYQGQIQGFFQLDLKDAQLDALYVHPFMHNRGLGTAMLQRAEELAVKANLSFLKLYSSSNAVGFYTLNDYDSLGAAVLPLNSRVGVACELMRKSFR